MPGKPRRHAQQEWSPGQYSMAIVGFVKHVGKIRRFAVNALISRVTMNNFYSLPLARPNPGT